MQIRPITDFAELQRCVALQQIVWGGEFAELVPAAMLWVGTRTGGVVAGAFDERNELLGFVFGITGFVDGQPLHWSDMLAVHPNVRGTGVGQALKAHQRTALLARGVTQVNWTFDPLESRNAHINFARLGVTSSEYLLDVYGRSSSPLHVGLSTDRLVASWQIDSARVRSRMEGEPPEAQQFDDVPVINSGDQPDLDRREPQLRLRIPADIQSIKQQDLALAIQWRAVTRAAFLTYFGRGYRAVELLRGSTGDLHSYYVLAQED